MTKTLAVVVLLLALPFVAFAQGPVTKTTSVTVTATIESLDRTARTITFKDQDGNLGTVFAGPEVKRYDELKVGDKVTFTYKASVVVKVQKPGDPAVPTASGQAVVERGTGAKPGAKITRPQTATVLIKAIDPKVPAMTVQTEDGRTVSFDVEDKSLLTNFKAGDRVQITYTEALMINVQ